MTIHLHSDRYVSKPPHIAGAAAQLIGQGRTADLQMMVDFQLAMAGSVLLFDLPSDDLVPFAEELAELNHSDLILIEPSRADGLLRFRVGVRLSWMTLWHTDFCLWQPRNRGPVCFVPKNPDEKLFFWLEDGRLACDRGQPFVDANDRRRGFSAAHAAMMRLAHRSA